MSLWISEEKVKSGFKPIALYLNQITIASNDYNAKSSLKYLVD